MSPRLHRWVQEMNFRNNSLNVQSDFGKKTLAPYFSEFSITHRLVAQICLSIIVHHIPIDLFFSHKKFPLFFPLPSIVCVCVFFLKSHITLASPSEDNMHFIVLCVKFKVFPVIWDCCFDRYFSSKSLMGTQH